MNRKKEWLVCVVCLRRPLQTALNNWGGHTHTHWKHSHTLEAVLGKANFKSNVLQYCVTLFFIYFFYSRSFINYGWTTVVTWTILTMSLLDFWALTVEVPLLSMGGQKALRFPQKYLNLCSEDEQRSYWFGTAWGRVIKDRIFILGEPSL